MKVTKRCYIQELRNLAGRRSCRNRCEVCFAWWKGAFGINTSEPCPHCEYMIEFDYKEGGTKWFKPLKQDARKEWEKKQRAQRKRQSVRPDAGIQQSGNHVSAPNFNGRKKPLRIT